MNTEDIARQVAFNMFCPTGEGGGVDPSCGKGGGGFTHGDVPATEGKTKIHALSDTLKEGDKITGLRMQEHHKAGWVSEVGKPHSPVHEAAQSVHMFLGKRGLSLHKDGAEFKVAKASTTAVGKFAERAEHKDSFEQSTLDHHMPGMPPKQHLEALNKELNKRGLEALPHPKGGVKIRLQKGNVWPGIK